MQVFVYYHDDYADNGGVGIERFASRDEAASFITQRLARVQNPDTKRYTVIEGRVLTVNPVTFATRVNLELDV